MKVQTVDEMAIEARKQGDRLGLYYLAEKVATLIEIVADLQEKVRDLDPGWEPDEILE